MTIVDLAKSIVVIADESNGKGSFQLGNKKFVQFSDTFDENQMVTAGNTAFQKAYQDENLNAFVNPDGVSTDHPLTVTSAQFEQALPEESAETAIKIAFLISKAQGISEKNLPITDAFTLERFGTDKLQYTFTDGGQWPV